MARNTPAKARTDGEGGHISAATIRRFGLFTDERLEFSPGINVLIGRNACGKSHLLKLLYSLVREAGRSVGNGAVLDADKLSARLEKTLAGVFRPGDDHIGRLVQRGVGRRSAAVSLHLSGGAECGFKLSSLDNLSAVRSTAVSLGEAVFIPATETLALFEGLVAAYEKRELAVDQTVYDLCLLLASSKLKGARSSLLNSLASPLEEEFRGTVVLRGGRFYVNGEDGSIEAHLLSEGWRKLAVIAQLILNGSLAEKSYLFWDEPEANLNPRMIVQVADTLLRLANRGVQVFVATHDYLLSTRLSLASEYPDQLPTEQRCPIKFFGLSRRDSDAAGVAVSSGASLSDLAENPILSEYAALYDYEGELFARSQVGG